MTPRAHSWICVRERYSKDCLRLPFLWKQNGEKNLGRTFDVLIQKLFFTLYTGINYH